jgi:hypothetical protein
LRSLNIKAFERKPLILDHLIEHQTALTETWLSTTDARVIGELELPGYTLYPHATSTVGGVDVIILTFKTKIHDNLHNALCVEVFDVDVLMPKYCDGL